MTSPLFKILCPLFLSLFFASNSFATSDTSLVDMRVSVTLKPGNPRITGIAQTKLSNLAEGKVIPGSAKIIRITTISGKKLAFKLNDHAIELLTKGLSGEEQVNIAFETVVGKRPSFKDPSGGPDFISSRYILLTGPWHPRLPGLSTYRLKLRLDEDFVPVSEADEIISKGQGGNKKEVTFIFDEPRRSITLVAAKFFKKELKTNGVTLSVYLLQERQELADKFLGTLAKAVASYDKLISPYPFRRFQVVETPLPVGVTVPTITLLGSQIIDKPFVADVSLIHEFVHSWFGNSVFVAPQGGNWCEGLTTYMADYLNQEKAGKGLEYRHDILADYKSYVHPSNAFPLSQFQFRFDRVSKAIGYGKCAMVFHMLRKMAGDETFFGALSSLSKEYRFKQASWDDIQRVFSKAMQRDLSAFFKQWLSRKDVPHLALEGATEEKQEDGSFKVKITIVQKNEQPYELDVPVRILTSTSSKTFTVKTKGFKTTSEFSVSGWPRLVVIDPGFNIMRDLALEEFPPSLARLFGAEKRFLILPSKEEKDLYAPMVSFLKTKGFDLIERDKLKHEMLKEGSFLVLGTTSGRLEAFTGKSQVPENGVVVKVRNNPLNPHQVAASLKASSRKELEPVIHKLPHYGKYAFLKFQHGLIQEKSSAGYEKGLALEVTPEVSGIFSQKIDFMDSIIQGLDKYQVIYLGEKHDQEGIHQVQLKIIEALSRKAPLAVGMEMFQRPFQNIIDDYMAGRIDEKQFLDKTQYFKRWAFNYHFYRPIVEFCKAKGIPLVALNLRTEVSKKIARSGLSSLSPEERKELPEELNLENELYKRYLRQIYSAHQDEGELDDFDHFYQAQIAWDETMAQSIADYLENHPDRKMVIIVGGGHVEYGYGIPSRVKRRMPHLRQAISLFNQPAPLDPSMADLFLYAPEVKEPFLPKLGVVLVGENKLTVEAVVPDSPAAKAGLKKGDVITALDGNPVKDIYDLKLELFFKKKGEQAKITVLRKDKSGVSKEIELVSGPLVPVEWNRMKLGFHHMGK
ncbi:MAG: PDZ domain-containing protein [Thermodesulfobacteria bacterium]|nr:PDZ domain-containing protein [Thermodesulfobacteriota bacterium]